MDERESLADRGEAGLIQAMAARLPVPPAGAIGIGDDAAMIPLDPGVAHVAAARGQDPLAFALAGGEDYHLVGTCAPADWPALATRVPTARIVGRVEAGAPGAWLARGHGPREALAGEMGHALFARSSFPPR